MSSAVERLLHIFTRWAERTMVDRCRWLLLEWLHRILCCESGVTLTRASASGMPTVMWGRYSYRQHVTHTQLQLTCVSACVCGILIGGTLMISISLAHHGIPHESIATIYTFKQSLRYNDNRLTKQWRKSNPSSRDEDIGVALSPN